MCQVCGFADDAQECRSIWNYAVWTFGASELSELSREDFARCQAEQRELRSASSLVEVLWNHVRVPDEAEAEVGRGSRSSNNMCDSCLPNNDQRRVSDLNCRCWLYGQPLA